MQEAPSAPTAAQYEELRKKRWFVCQANPQRMTHSLRDALEKQHIIYYMALERQLERRGQQMVDVEVSLLGSYFFVQSTLLEALKIKSDYGLDYQYVRDGHKQLLWVPDKRLADFRLLIEKGSSDLDLHADVYAVGDEVIVTRGPLCGVEGILVGADDKHLRLLLKIPSILAISVHVAKSNVRKINVKGIM